MFSDVPRFLSPFDKIFVEDMTENELVILPDPLFYENRDGLKSSRHS